MLKFKISYHYNRNDIIADKKVINVIIFKQLNGAMRSDVLRDRLAKAVITFYAADTFIVL